MCAALNAVQLMILARACVLFVFTVFSSLASVGVFCCVLLLTLSYITDLSILHIINSLLMM